MLLAGTWRSGSADKTATDTDPYRGDTLTVLKLADEADLDEAYEAAAEAQRHWAAQPPADRAAVMQKAADVFRARRDEIIDWTIRETGATRTTAEFTHQITLRDFQEAASYPYRVQGRILLSDTPGKENRVYRQPVGVVAVISP
jgi:aldehyde dehydrogenase (NAD+)